MVLRRRFFREFRANPASGEREILKCPPLHRAVLEGKLEDAEGILDNGFDVNHVHEGMTALEVACGCGNSEILEMLIVKRGALINVPRPPRHRLDDRSRMKLEMRNGDDCGHDPHDSFILEDSALHLAVEANSVKCLQILLNAGMDINMEDGIPSTAMHLAAESNQRVDCLKFLFFKRSRSV